MGTTALTLAYPGLLRAATADKRRPNIVFILADDLGVGDIGPFGQKKIKTPSLDKMAAEGMRFTQAYAGASVCAPSRCTLMTGQHTGHASVRANREIQPEGQMAMPAGTVTVASMLKSAGYKTGAFGKWGLGYVDSTSAPDKMGFDCFFGYNCQRQAHSYYPDHLWRNRERVPLGGTTYSHDLIAGEALKWVRANAGSPFFLYLPFTIPHAKYEVPDLGPYANEPWADVLKKYAAMVTRMDRDIGRLFALLKELNLDNNTVVFFASDNGQDNATVANFFKSNGIFRGTKRSAYEGGTRSPSLAWWPGVIKPGSVCETPWVFYDFMATAAEIAGVPVPAAAKTDGLSIMPLLRGTAMPSREFLYWELHEGPIIQGVRMGDWKAAKHGPVGPIELFNLATDPSETTDVAKAHPDMVKRAAALLVSQHTPSDLWPIRP